MINISGSVGKNGNNIAPDVGRIQTMLNASDAIAPIKVDNRFGPMTFKAILQFQMTVFPTQADWDGLIGRNGKTLRALANPNIRFMREVIAAEVNAQSIKLGGFMRSQQPATANAATSGNIVPLRTVTSTYKGLSGARWCPEFPTSVNTADLASPFRENVEKFRAAVAKAGISLPIAATFRPLERAWLMHWAYDIAHGGDPRKVPPHAGIDIDWIHVDSKGNFDAAASKKAAIAMNTQYRSRVKPSLTSLHISGNAIDMSGSWPTAKSILDGKGNTIVLPAGASDASNPLNEVAMTYGVVKRTNDGPHWSVNGR